MIMMLSSPVSPRASPSTPGEAAEPSTGHEDKEEIVNLDAVADKHIIGVEQPDAGHRHATPLPSPPEMTPAQRAIHNLTHQPPHRGCPICAASRTPNVKHGPTDENSRTIPLLVEDYCYLRLALDTFLATCSLMRLYPYR